VSYAIYKAESEKVKGGMRESTTNVDKYADDGINPKWPAVTNTMLGYA
jgi:hypothetical protein